MEKPHYELKSTPNALQHVFESVSDDKVIQKIVAYIPTEDDDEYYQLIFGDLLPNGKIDTLSISNNNDMRMVLTTVVSTLFSFFEQNPNKIVFFTGSTLSRTRLYRAVISKFIQQTELFYDIKGITEDESIEKFDNNHSYIAYLIELKK